MAPIAVVEHQLPGRARLRISSKKGDATWFASLVEQLASHPKIDELHANPRTGSILIRHQKPLDLRELLTTIGSLIEITAEGPDLISAPAPQIEALAAAPAALDVVATGLLGLSAFQAVYGQPLGAAVEHFWSAYGSARVLRSPPLAVGFAALGFYQLMRGQVIGSAASLLYYALTVHHVAEGGGWEGTSLKGKRSHGADQG
ncbi:HMA2 domain-containing protein [Microvirga sp. M2]|uniref:HMA2 domain-containing protein n=1 Tax=Microvirga sp. M2 TaxID=3073270 RepID=UPI0039C2086F